MWINRIVKSRFTICLLAGTALLPPDLVAQTPAPPETPTNPGPPATPSRPGAPPTTANSAAGAVTLRWARATGAAGYRIQLRDADDRNVHESELNANQLRINLPAGKYSYRVAPLDAFGQPADWSAWFAFQIRPTGTPRLSSRNPEPIRTGEARANVVIAGRNLFPYTRVRIVSSDGRRSIPVDVSRDSSGDLQLRFSTKSAAPGRYDLELINPGGKVLRQPDFVVIRSRGLAGIGLANLVPGLPQIRRGQSAKGVGWMTLFVGLGGAGIAEWQQAESVARAKKDDALVQSFNDPVWYLGFARGQFRGTGAGPLLASLAYLEGTRRTRQYDAHQRNQALIGGAALLAYIGHWIDLFYFEPAERSPGSRARTRARVDFSVLPARERGRIAGGFSISIPW